MQKHIYHYTFFGQVKDTEAYGGGTYTSAEYGDTTRTQNDIELANTGQDFIAPLLLGVAMVVGSVVALVKMHKTKKVQ